MARCIISVLVTLSFVMNCFAQRGTLPLFSKEEVFSDHTKVYSHPGTQYRLILPGGERSDWVDGRIFVGQGQIVVKPRGSEKPVSKFNMTPQYVQTSWGNDIRKSKTRNGIMLMLLGVGAAALFGVGMVYVEGKETGANDALKDCLDRGRLSVDDCYDTHPEYNKKPVRLLTAGGVLALVTLGWKGAERVISTEDPYFTIKGRGKYDGHQEVHIRLGNDARFTRQRKRISSAKEDHPNRFGLRPQYGRLGIGIEMKF